MRMTFTDEAKENCRLSGELRVRGLRGLFRVAGAVVAYAAVLPRPVERAAALVPVVAANLAVGGGAVAPRYAHAVPQAEVLAAPRQAQAVAPPGRLRGVARACARPADGHARGEQHGTGASVVFDKIATVSKCYMVWCSFVVIGHS